MEIIRLERINFDIMENRNPYSIEILATFCADNGSLTPHGKCDELLKKLPPVKLYLGWDGEVYPKIRLVKEYAK